MTDATITINPDGTGSVLLEGSTTTVEGTTAADARRQAITHITQRAASLGRPISATAHESGRVYPVLVNTDGTVSQLTRNEGAVPPPSVEPAATPAPEPASARTITEAPKAEPGPELDVTQPTPSQNTDLQLDPASHQPLLDDAANVPPANGIEETVEAEDNRSGDPVDVDPRWVDISKKPAEHGWQGTLNGMGLKISPAEKEIEHRREILRQQIVREEEERVAKEERTRTQAAQEGRRAAREREAAQQDREQRAVIQTSFEEPKNVLIANDKGGQGKTTAGYCIGATAGRIRGGDVVAWDANETRGNLGFRAQKAPTPRSVVDLLEEAAEDFTTVQGSKRSTLARYTRNQGDNLFTVLASDESRDRQDLVDAEAFEKVHEILGRFYSLILIDTGNNHRVSHFTAALAATDQLVVPVSAGADGAYAAETMMDTFESLGYGDLVKNAVVLLNDSATRRGDATGIATKFEQRVRAIIPIPFDPALDSGEEIDFDTLQPATRAAYQEATAAIARGLAGTTEG